MKVFLSWSGDKSHKVALVFKEWFPSVIQSLEPYVSSEDIDKGKRWSTDIAKELEDSTFGILCVTKENIDAPWLTFEAGALSKTMENSFVSPFLYNIKRSEVSGPILQFQSTVFEKEDVRKLLNALNKACGENKLSDQMLTKAFDVWWPSLQEKLDEIKEVVENNSTEQESESAAKGSEILEEILDLTRTNQKILRNPNQSNDVAYENISKKLEDIAHSIDREKHFRKKRAHKFHPLEIIDLMKGQLHGNNRFVGLQIVLNLYRDDFPWLHDSGLELIKLLKSDVSLDEKEAQVAEFCDLVELTSEHPIFREMYGNDKMTFMFLHEMSFVFRELFQRLTD